jgi:hypothetical protein
MNSPLALTASPPMVPLWSDRAARFYASALDRSDYAPAAAAALREMLGTPGSLLDIGAGAGQPVAAWLPPDTTWTAVEPSRYLRARLGRLWRTAWPALRPLNATWESLPRLALPPHEVALAANIGGPLTAPQPLLAPDARQRDRCGRLDRPGPAGAAPLVPVRRPAWRG